MAVSANRLELLQIADAVAREKSIDRMVVIEAMQDVQSQSTSGASAISQAAAVAALTGDQDLLTESAEIFRKSRDSVPGAINDEPLLSCALPDGAFLHLCLLRKRRLGVQPRMAAVFLSTAISATTCLRERVWRWFRAVHFRCQVTFGFHMPVPMQIWQMAQPACAAPLPN